MEHPTKVCSTQSRGVTQHINNHHLHSHILYYHLINYIVYEQPEYDPSKDAMAMYASGERYQAFEPSSEECYVDQSEDYEDEMAMRSNDGALVKYRTFSEFMYP